MGPRHSIFWWCASDTLLTSHGTALVCKAFLERRCCNATIELMHLSTSHHPIVFAIRSNTEYKLQVAWPELQVLLLETRKPIITIGCISQCHSGLFTDPDRQRSRQIPGDARKPDLVHTVRWHINFCKNNLIQTVRLNAGNVVRVQDMQASSQGLHSAHSQQSSQTISCGIHNNSQLLRDHGST